MNNSGLHDNLIWNGFSFIHQEETLPGWGYFMHLTAGGKNCPPSLSLPWTGYHFTGCVRECSPKKVSKLVFSNWLKMSQYKIPKLQLLEFYFKFPDSSRTPCTNLSQHLQGPSQACWPKQLACTCGTVPTLEGHSNKKNEENKEHGRALKQKGQGRMRKNGWTRKGRRMPRSTATAFCTISVGFAYMNATLIDWFCCEIF